MSTFKKLNGVQLIKHLGYNLWQMALHSGNKKLLERIENPEIGDLVLETTTLYFDDPRKSGLGWLMDIVDEDCYEEGDWDVEAEGRAMPTEKAYYIQTFGDEAKMPLGWTNCHFIMIPTGILDGILEFKEDYKGRALKDYPMYYNLDGSLWKPEVRKKDRRDGELI